MRRRSSTIAHAVALCMALTTVIAPAHAQGLISTERAAAPATAGLSLLEDVQARVQVQRARLQSTLVEGGVEAGQAAQRLAALSDAEIAELTLKIDSAPAGGLWFMPFLVVAAVIGMLISTREASPSGPSRTDLFGRPLIAVAP